MNFKEPYHVYTAATNIEAHVIVDLLAANGIPAIAVEDQSGASLWMFGTISQFHKPKVWVDKATAERAHELLLDYENRQHELRHPSAGGGQLQVTCEECGKSTAFADALNGTVQICPHCGAHVDVGEFDWEGEDFGESDEA